MKKLVVTVEPSSDGLWARIEQPIELIGVTSGTTFAELEESLQDLIQENIQFCKEDGKEVPDILINNTGFKYQVDLSEYLEELPLDKVSLARYSGMNRSLLARYAKGDLTTFNQFGKVLKGVKKAVEDISSLNLELA